ncbi:MAG TPA: hypothetical protein VJM31_09210 [Vicinamibacterales bacterium]|nr:hypothetical protein [Vicinamibacterales bacterium]
MAIRTIAITVAICCTAAIHAADKNPYNKLSKEKRIEAVRLAQVWAPIDTASLDLEAGPPMPGAFAPGETTTCDYFQKDSGGKTPKFWCRVSPKDEVKVKYGENNGEVYAEVAATRLLWALGFGADGMYPVKVICRGCSADPFKDEPKASEKTKPDTTTSHTFDPAVGERPMPGDVMESGKDSGWGWIDLNSVDQTRGGALVAHRDALKLLAVFMQHTDTKPAQQRLLCLDRTKGLPASPDGSCKHPFMMLGDLGKTFGKANLFNKDDPGAVNLKAWDESGIWRGDEGCVGDMDQSFTGTLDRPKISEEGRKFLAEQLMKLSDEQIRDLFAVSQFTRRDKTSTIEDWVRVFKEKREEIAGRTCTAAAR